MMQVVFRPVLNDKGGDIPLNWPKPSANYVLEALNKEKCHTGKIRIFIENATLKDSRQVLLDGELFLSAFYQSIQIHTGQTENQHNDQ